MTSSEFQHIVHTIPVQPGIYKYYDAGNDLLYVGKAKHLRKRVSSYFTKTFTSYKTHELVQRIDRIEFTIVDSEQDAFLLENTLIKQYQPRYNINLKDDKTYPFIVIKKEPFPRVFLTRQKIPDGSEYLGPYTSVKKVRELLDFIQQTIRLRNCSLNLTEKNIQKGRFKVCLEYHLGNCKGPCENLQTAEDYDENLSLLKKMLRGNLAPVIRYYKKEMQTYASTLAFEKAEMVRKRIDFLESYQSRSLVANARAGNLDVFSIIKARLGEGLDKEIFYVNYLMVRNGAIMQTHTTQAVSRLDESIEEILGFSIGRLQTTFNSDAAEVIVPFEVAYPKNDIKIIVPRGGDRKKLLELSEKNARHFIEELENNERLQLNSKGPDKKKMLEQLQLDLQLAQLPVHIECFDNSNFQGSYPVAAMVCFRNGEPSKKEYRHYNIKSVTGINDFGSMKEVVYRRYKRLAEEKAPFPQLVIIDGGKGQLSSAREAIIDLGLAGRMTLVGLAKNEEEIYFSGDSSSIKLSYTSESLKFIRRIRDEVHRFGIRFHRQKRSKGALNNELEQIKGIGTATADLLLKEFRSLKKIKEKNIEDLAQIIGRGKAKTVVAHFLKGKKAE